MTYYVRPHDDHYHVIEGATEEHPTLLDDRPLNPWLFFEKHIAENVAMLLNGGVEAHRIKAMDAHEISARCDELRRRPRMTDDARLVRAAFDALLYKAEHNDPAEDGYDPRPLREITTEFTERMSAPGIVTVDREGRTDSYSITFSALPGKRFGPWCFSETVHELIASSGLSPCAACDLVLAADEHGSASNEQPDPPPELAEPSDVDRSESK